MKRLARLSFTVVRRAIGYGLLGAVIALVGVAIYTLTRKADLEIWHHVHLDEEFGEDSNPAHVLADFTDYLELEERLFKQLDDEIYAKTAPGNADTINRYQRGSRVDSITWKTN